MVYGGELVAQNNNVELSSLPFKPPLGRDADYAAQMGPQLLELPVGALELCAIRSRFSRARFRSSAPVGNITFLG